MNSKYINRTYQLPKSLAKALDGCARSNRLYQSRLVEFSLRYVLSRVASGEIELPMTTKIYQLDMQAAHAERQPDEADSGPNRVQA